MVQSLNTKVDLVMDGTSFLGLPNYGEIMIGDKAFEFYNDRDVNKYIQIPWEEVDCVQASVVFKGKWIPRFAIQTKKNGTYQFAAKNPKKLLRAMQVYVNPKKMVRALSFSQMLTRGIKGTIAKHKKK